MTIPLVAALALAAQVGPATGQEQQSHDLDRLLREVTADVEANSKLTQVMVDKILSFSELRFQEVETSRYLVNLLRENGFDVREGVSGMPTAWWATWGSGGPAIAFGSDIDGIPKARQKPGVAYQYPIVEGAPGHGEGHNSGQAVNVTAALALKRVMERERIPGTLVLWPGVAEELLAAKAWFVRDGLFEGVDAVFFTHVGNNLGVTWGDANGTGLVSAEFQFSGEAAHSPGAPWRGRSALDAAMLMDIGWNCRGEHLRPEQRSHFRAAVVTPDAHEAVGGPGCRSFGTSGSRTPPGRRPRSRTGRIPPRLPWPARCGPRPRPGRWSGRSGSPDGCRRSSRPRLRTPRRRPLNPCSRGRRRLHGFSEEN